MEVGRCPYRGLVMLRYKGLLVEREVGERAASACVVGGGGRETRRSRWDRAEALPAARVSKEWALEAGPVEREAPRRRWACLAGLSSPSYLFLKQKKNKEEKKKEGGRWIGRDPEVGGGGSTGQVPRF